MAERLTTDWLTRTDKAQGQRDYERWRRRQLVIAHCCTVLAVLLVFVYWFAYPMFGWR